MIPHETPSPADGERARSAEADLASRAEKLDAERRFPFACHRELACWNSCCVNESLFLTPYDLLRLKNRLGITSGRLLDERVATGFDPAFGAPLVRLQMTPESGRCPFAGPEGCAVYEDRPTACRVFPLGHGVAGGGDDNAEGFYYLLDDTERCHGLAASKVRTLTQWKLDQALDRYGHYNDLTDRLVYPTRLGVPTAEEAAFVGGLFMTLFDLDRFRAMVFDGPLLDDLSATPEELLAARTDDETLLTLALRRVARLLGREASVTPGAPILPYADPAQR